MDPPLCGAAVISHNEVSEIDHQRTARRTSPMKQEISGSVTKRLLFLCYARLSEERWRELCIMDYELRIVVEKVAVSSEEVVQRDTIASYALQCPTSILGLGLRHGEQISLLEKIQDILLTEQSI